MYTRFGLVLMVTHACNLRCSYCYAGRKTALTMPEPVGRKAIDRAIASLAPGGTLELGFFGGEPLLECELVESLMAHARKQTTAAGAGLTLSLTTNATVVGPEAWALMTSPDLELAVSCEGLPETHDRHRTSLGGNGTSGQVLATIQRLVDAGRDFRVVMVVRPDTMAALPEGIRYLRDRGVRHIEPSLDVWARWTEDDIARLEAAIAKCARIWRDGLPHHSIGWFDEKAAQLARLETAPTARCGFGHGELAVAPSGRLYPCERLIGDDDEGDPMAMPGHALDGDDFMGTDDPPARSHTSCDACTMVGMCNTFCRCSNYVRTGDVRTPDRLLCAWNQACLTGTAETLNHLAASRTQQTAAGVPS